MWNFKLYYQQLHLKYLCNLARYWLQAVWGWHDSVETCSSVIICEIIVDLLVIVRNNKRCTVQRIEITVRCCYSWCLMRWSDQPCLFITLAVATDTYPVWCSFAGHSPLTPEFCVKKTNETLALNQVAVGQVLRPVFWLTQSANQDYSYRAIRYKHYSIPANPHPKPVPIHTSLSTYLPQ